MSAADRFSIVLASSRVVLMGRFDYLSGYLAAVYFLTVGLYNACQFHL
jgi:hypothetical protein